MFLYKTAHFSFYLWMYVLPLGLLPSHCSDPGASPGQKCGVDMHDERMEGEPITAVWGWSPSRIQGQSLAKVGWTRPPQSIPWRRPCSSHSLFRAYPLLSSVSIPLKSTRRLGKHSIRPQWDPAWKNPCWERTFVFAAEKNAHAKCQQQLLKSLRASSYEAFKSYQTIWTVKLTCARL